MVNYLKRKKKSNISYCYSLKSKCNYTFFYFAVCFVENGKFVSAFIVIKELFHFYLHIIALIIIYLFFCLNKIIFTNLIASQINIKCLCFMHYYL